MSHNKISWKQVMERYEELSAMTPAERVEILGEAWADIFEGLPNPHPKKKESANCSKDYCDISNESKGESQ